MEILVMIGSLLQNGYLIAGQAGVFAGVALFGVALALGLWRQPTLLSPREYQAEQLMARPVGAGEFPPDVAWPFYTFRQAGIDRRVVRGYLRDLYRRVWKWPADTFFRGLHGSRLIWWILLFPLTAAALIALLSAGLSAWFCYAVYWLVVMACMTVNGMVFGLVLSCMRAAERRRRTTRRAHASCVNCFHVTPWPAYRCPRCRELHHDVRPGRLGLFARRCECGTRFPTMASRAAWRLTAVCKRCGQPLPTGAGAVRDVRVPVFGDTSAGKTRFLYASLNSLLQSAQQADFPVGFADEQSRKSADSGLAVIRSGQDTPKTSVTIPVALSARLGEGRGSELIHLFDAAGEQYRDAQQYDALRFLDDSHGLVYVLDPFAVPAVTDRLAGHNAAVIRLAHAAAGDPDIAYGEVVSRLRDGGVSPASQRLAVVVSKADLLRGTGLALPAESGAIAAWLTDMGMHNLVLSAAREFAEVRYFTVASQDGTGDPGRSRLDDPGVPLRWLLTAHGVRLPTDAAAPGDPGPPPKRPAEARS